MEYLYGMYAHCCFVFYGLGLQQHNRGVHQAVYCCFYHCLATRLYVNKHESLFTLI